MTWEEEFYELLADGVGTAEIVDFIKALRQKDREEFINLIEREKIETLNRLFNHYKE